jgi:hypothetical protein
MKVFVSISRSINRSFRILKVMKWKRNKARLAYEAWVNNEEFVSVGSRAF